ncbi:transporter [Natrinema sp. 74]
MARLSTIIILVGVVRFTPLPPPLGIGLGGLLILVGGILRLFTEK